MLLHIVNKSPTERNTFDSCLQHAKKGSSILLIEDGIYAALTGTEVSDKVKNAMKEVNIYALAPDINARGMNGRIIEGVKLVDYSGFVDLAAEHDSIQSWL